MGMMLMDFLVWCCAPLGWLVGWFLFGNAPQFRERDWDAAVR